MRKIHSTIAALAVVTIALVGCEQQAADDTGAAEEEVATADVDLEAEFDELRTDYEEAWNARDWDAVVGKYTEDYEEFTPEGEMLAHGDVKTALQDTAQGGPPEGARIAIDIESREIAESGDIAYATGTSTVTVPSPDGEAFTQTERWMAGFERVDGEWKIDRLIRSTTGTEGATTGEAAPADAPIEEDEPTEM